MNKSIFLVLFLIIGFTYATQFQVIWDLNSGDNGAHPPVNITTADSVLFNVTDGQSHTITLVSGPADISAKQVGGANPPTALLTFTTPGQYNFRCDNHNQMTVTINVAATEPPVTATPTSPVSNPDTTPSPTTAAPGNGNDGVHVTACLSTILVGLIANFLFL